MPSVEMLFIVIAGCGRMGAYLANKLSHDGHSVVVIDKNEAAFDVLTSEFSGFRVEGDATEFAVLKKAKADRADLVIAATSEDNINLMVAQVARNIFKIPRVLAFVYDPKRAEIYHNAGVETYCPITITADLFIKSITKSQVKSKKRGS
jgi:trk system potassium uptake protein TrkA